MTDDSSAEDQFHKAMSEHRVRFPKQRKPCVLVCGGTGSGKSTTINTLFSADVAAVGHFARGTTTSEVYEWVSHGTYIDIVDLPGLGDSKDRDREYMQMYRRHVATAHGFIVVTTPPRPASLPTLRTVKLLLSCGVPAHNITFAFNRLALLNATVDGELQPIDMSTLAGPIEEEEKQLVEQARLSFFADVCAGTGNSEFVVDQIVPYDALTGWNLFRVLDSVAANLPDDTIVPWGNAISQSAQRAIDKQAKKSQRDKRRMEELESQLTALQSAQAERESAELRALRKELERRRKLEKAVVDSIAKTKSDDAIHKRGLVDRVADNLDSKGWKGAAATVRAVRDTAKKLFDYFR